MYARMVIGEANNEEQVQEFARIYTAEVLPGLEHEPGFVSARLMVEEDGRMAVSLTLWKTSGRAGPSVSNAKTASATTAAALTGSSWRARSICLLEILS